MEHGSPTAAATLIARIVDAHDRLRVPPENPRYTLRRVWLDKQEEDGYYYGFSNEGLWPLCHIAHARPTFRASDWDNTKRSMRNLQMLWSRKWPAPIIPSW